MRPFIRTVLFCCAGFLAIPLFAAFEKENLTPGQFTLDKGTRYYLTENGTYRLTTNGAVVDALIEVNPNISATIILENCLIEATTTVYDYTYEATGSTGCTNAALRIRTTKPVELYFSGENKLTTASPGNQPCQAIYAPPNYAATLIISKADDAPENSSLYLRGNSSTSSFDANNYKGSSAYPGSSAVYNYPVINLPQTGRVVFLSGDVTIATTEALNDATGVSYRIPALVSAKTIEFRGGTLTAQISPMATSSGLNATVLNTKISPLFDCTTFLFSNGTLTTAGEKEMPTSGNGVTSLISTSKAYNSHYSYNDAKLTTLTDGTTIKTLSGGEIQAKSKVYFHGFPVSSSIPAACFTHTGSTPLSAQTSDKDGIISLSNSTYPNIQRNYKNAQSKEFVEVFDAPILCTDEGLVANALFGVSAITIDPETSLPILTLALHLPDDTTNLSKTFGIKIFRQPSLASEKILIANKVLTFTRTSTTDYFTVTYPYTDDKAALTERTSFYTIQAYR